MKTLRFTNPQPPEQVQISPTYRCNLRCIFCWLSKDPPGIDQVSDERFMEVLKEICCDIGPERVLITGGGEPMVKRELVNRMIDEIQRHDGISGRLITNGTLFDQDFVEKLVSLRWEHLDIPLHSPRSEFHDSICRREGTFEAITRNIRMLGKRSLEAQSPYPHISIKFVVMRHNFREIVEMIDFAEELGVAQLSLRMVNEDVQAGRRLCLPEEEYAEFMEVLEKAKEAAKNREISFVVEFSEEEFQKYLSSSWDLETTPRVFRGEEECAAGDGHEDEAGEVAEEKPDDALPETGEMSWEEGAGMSVCQFPFVEANIYPSGYVTPCGLFFTSHLPDYSETDLRCIDNILEKSFSEVWYGEHFNTIRSMMISRHFPGRCKSCNVNFSRQEKMFSGPAD